MGDTTDNSAALLQASNDLARVGYGIYTDQRDSNYQRELNIKMMDRQDSEIQRRVRDAILAGINPYDAIGSGSGASSAAGTGYKSSGLPEGLNVGSLLEYNISRERLIQERQRTKQEQIFTKISGDNAIRSAIEREYALLGFRNNTGFRPFTNSEGDFYVDYPSNENYYDFYMRSPQYKQFMASYNNFMNQSDILRKENQWYNTNQILDAINSGTGSVGNVIGAFHGGASSYRDINVGSYYRNQNRDYSNQKLPAKIGF